MEKHLDGLNDYQSPIFHMSIPNLDIIEVMIQATHGMFFHNMVLLHQYHFYSRNDSIELKEIVALVMVWVK